MSKEFKQAEKETRKANRAALVTELVSNGMSNDDAIKCARHTYPKPIKPKTDLTKSDETALADACTAFDSQHNDKPVARTTTEELVGDDKIIETQTKKILNDIMTHNPHIDLSVAMSVLVTILSNIQDNENLCGYVIQAIETLRDGGQAGDYRINNDGES